MARNESASPASLRMIIILLVAVTSLSQFFRSIVGPVGPEIAADLVLTNQQLAFANTCFFGALLVLQIPVGIAFDRFGAIRVTAALTGVAALGAAVCGLSENYILFLGGRILIGVGMAAAFMSVIVVLSDLVSDSDLGYAMAKVFALSNIGTIAASKPAALMTDYAGWRSVHLIAAAFAAIFAVIATVVSRHEKRTAATESLVTLAHGIWRAVKLPGLPYVALLLATTYPALITILGLWAGAYLAEIHNLSLEDRGNAQLAMVIAQVVGIYSFGFLDRMISRRRQLASWGGIMSSCALLGIVLFGDNVILSIGLLTVFCFFASYNVLLLSHARSLIPDDLAGRGITTINLIPGVGSSLLPIFTGMIVTVSAQAGMSPSTQYNSAFFFLAMVISAGAVIFLRSTHTKPQPN